MRVAIIGAGPAGLFTGAGLARRGHQVIAVERDPGPAADGSWPRLGVMQFHHAHALPASGRARTGAGTARCAAAVAGRRR